MKKIFNLIIFFTVLGALGTNVLAGQGMRPDHLKISNDGKEKKSDALLLPIRLYREYISRVDGKRRAYDPVSNNDFWWQ